MLHVTAVPKRLTIRLFVVSPSSSISQISIKPPSIVICRDPLDFVHDPFTSVEKSVCCMYLFSYLAFHSRSCVQSWKKEIIKRLTHTHKTFYYTTQRIRFVSFVILWLLERGIKAFPHKGIESFTWEKRGLLLGVRGLFIESFTSWLFLILLGAQLEYIFVQN